ncbi:co-chaperone GroES [Lentisphaerota bacterium WC36G]|nr:co-chaperone GroES [Lentisphaerae bacterium WC36]
MSDCVIKPLGGRVLVEACEAPQDQQVGGIFLPETAKEKPQESRVVALGTGKKDDNGNVIPFDVKVDDIVLTARFGATEVKYGSKEYKIVDQEDIIAVIG